MRGMSRTHGNSFSRVSQGASTSASRPPFILYDGIPEYDYLAPIRHCDCCKFAPRWTAWKETNPGRRFYGCPDFREKDVLRKCDYFVWHDVDFTDRAKDVIWYLYNERKRLLKENGDLRRQLNLKKRAEEDEVRRQRQSASMNEGTEEIATKQPVEQVCFEQSFEIERMEMRIHEIEKLVEKKMQSALCKVGSVIAVVCLLNLVFMFW